MSVKKKAMDRAKKLDRAGLQRVLTARLGDRQTVGVDDAVLRSRLVSAVLDGRLQLHELTAVSR